MSYESQDASVKVIGLGAGLVVILVAASLAISAWLYYARYHTAAAVPTSWGNGTFTHGSEQRSGIVIDYESVMRSAAEHLHGYAWVDENAGVARIPIERAMELTASGVKPAPTAKPPGQVP